MTDIIKTPGTTPGTSETVIKARFQAELTKIKFQEALQRIEDFKVTKDNIVEAQTHMKEARAFLGKLEAIKTAGKAPALEECRNWDAAYNSLKNPFDTVLLSKANDINRIATELETERLEKEKERKRVESIKTAITEFIVYAANQVVLSDDIAHLVSIEKLIGSHKANKAKYQEFLPELVDKCNTEVVPLIAKQKEHLKNLEKLKEKEKKATDDESLHAIAEEKEKVETLIQENKENIQSAALNVATSAELTNYTEVETTTVKTRRTSWKYELVDPKKAFAAGMLILEVDPERAKVVIATLKDMGKDEDTVSGIKYYQEKLY